MSARLIFAMWVGLASVALTGCVSGMLGRKIVEAPNRQNAAWPAKGSPLAVQFDRTFSQTLRVAAGPPAADIAVAILEPGDYQFRYGMAVETTRDGRRRPRFSIDWKTRKDAPPSEVRGTIFVLHGFLVSKETMMHWALFLAQQGYRAVLVDLRGHGASTGAWLTFGASEARDLTLVLDELKTRKLVAGEVGVIGSSYGAVMALHWAARDPRVKAIVALQPYSDPREAVVEFARGFSGFKKQAANMSDGTFTSALARAERLADFAWSEANVLESMARLRAPVLFFHGADDTWISPAHSERLHASAPQGSRRVLLPGENHETLSARLDPLALKVVEWFDQHCGARGAAIIAARRGDQ